MQKPPLILDATYITAEPPNNWDPFKDTTQGYSFSGMFGPAGANHKTREIMYNTQIALEQEFGAKSTLLPQSIEAELAATRLEGPTHSLPPAAALVRELGVRNTLIQRKTAELHRQTAIANRFYGSDPLGKKFNDFLNQASAIRRTDRSAGVRELWSQSCRAAHEARLLSQAIQLLNQQHINVLNWLAAVQAEDQARIAAEQEARRIAAELARINEQAQTLAREQARLAVLAEANDWLPNKHSLPPKPPRDKWLPNKRSLQHWPRLNARKNCFVLKLNGRSTRNSRRLWQPCMYIPLWERQLLPARYFPSPRPRSSSLPKHRPRYSPHCVRHCRWQLRQAPRHWALY